MKDLYTVIGANIRTRRKALGLSQEELAKKIGFLRTSLANLEQGRQRTPLHVIVKIADVFGVRAGELLPVALWPNGAAAEQRALEEKIADIKEMLQEIVEEL